jgi:arylsulfatase A-like enzyme
MHAFMVASGPSFREGAVSATPTGAVDIAPTVLALLGLPAPDRMDGRILHEALAEGREDPPSPEDAIMEATVPGGTPRRLLIHRVGATSYVHGSLVPAG